MVVTLGQQYSIGEKPTVILYTYINRHDWIEKRRKIKEKRENSKVEGVSSSGVPGRLLHYNNHMRILFLLQ